MTFSFNTGIPAAANNPSSDQPLMLLNNISNYGIWAVDHVTFNAANGGTHLQVTFNNKNPAGAQTDPTSVLYTNSGTASSISQLFYRNQNSIFPVSLIKAYAVFSNSATPSYLQSINFTGDVTFLSPTFTLTLASNVIFSSNPGIIVSTDVNSSVLNYNYSSGVLKISGVSALATQVTVLLLQL